jgi:hypothetical protein
LNSIDQILKPKSAEEICRLIENMDSCDFAIKFKGQKIKEINAKISFKKHLYFLIYNDNTFKFYKFIYFPMFSAFLIISLCQILFKNNDFLNSNSVHIFKWIIWAMLMIILFIHSKINSKIRKKLLTIQIGDIMFRNMYHE